MVERIKEFVINEIGNDNSGHNYQHALRVVNNAEKIIKKEISEKINYKIIICSCYLHDVVDKKLFTDIDAQLNKVIKILKQEKFTKTEIDEVIYIIKNISWNSGNFTELANINAQIVRDADRLDAIGAIGVIRTIEYGTSKQRLFYDDNNIKFKNGKFMFNEKSNSTLTHFYEKLLLLDKYMHTETGKALAKQRVNFLKKFLNQFYSEI